MYEQFLPPIRRFVRKGKPIRILVGYGPMKNPNAVSYSCADWAEFFAPCHLVAWHNKVQCVYPPGLQVRIVFDDETLLLANGADHRLMDDYLAYLRWGLIPSWASDPAIGNKLLNAREETVAEKPSFRSAFKRRRCVIPASGFYEWQKLGAGRKQPYAIRPRDAGLFSFAGLWERWRDPRGETIETCTILTTEANDVMRPLHERMPVILDPTADARWLDSGADAATLHSLLVPYSGERVEAYPVDTWVNSPKHKGAALPGASGSFLT
jgi:putative SOS response-associated peptidase YedK